MIKNLATLSPFMDCPAYLPDVVVLCEGGGVVDPDVGHLHGVGPAAVGGGGGGQHGLLGQAEGRVAREHRGAQRVAPAQEVIGNG